MHILFIGYGKTSQKLAQLLFEQGHQISTISLTTKTDHYANHHIQDVHELNLADFPQIDWVYILLSPKDSTKDAYQHTYLESTLPIINALKVHPIQRLVVLSSTRVYGENAGEVVTDETVIQPSDHQGQILYEMEQTYLTAYPDKCIIVRPSGIYGTSVQRLQKMAAKQNTYPNLHWSNRIHIHDLVRFLAELTKLEDFKSSYILTNDQPQLLHEILQWFQQQMYLPQLQVTSDHVTGKKLYATHIQQMGFKLLHQDCYTDYAQLMSSRT